MSEMGDFKIALINASGRYTQNMFDHVIVDEKNAGLIKHTIGFLVDKDSRTKGSICDTIWRSFGLADEEPTKKTAELFIAKACGFRVIVAPVAGVSPYIPIEQYASVDVPRDWTPPDEFSVEFDADISVDMSWRATIYATSQSSDSVEGYNADELYNAVDCMICDAEFPSDCLDADNCNTNNGVVTDRDISIRILSFDILRNGDVVYSSGHSFNAYLDSADDVHEFERKILYSYCLTQGDE